MAKCNGDIVAIDNCYPFNESHPEVKGGGHHALIVVGSLSLYVNCSSIGKLSGRNALSTFLNGWVRPMGKPRRILMDNGGPGLRSTIWTDASDTSGWQIVTTPPLAQSQNGIAERAVRSLKTEGLDISPIESHPQGGCGK